MTITIPHRPHHDLLVWQDSMDLVDEVYSLSSEFPKEEEFILIPHLRKSAISVPSNIAEGAGRGGNREFGRFLGISCGSLSELETQLQIAHRRHMFTSETDAFTRIDRLFAMLNGLKRSLR